MFRFKVSILNKILPRCRYMTAPCTKSSPTNGLLQKTAVGLLPLTNQLNLVDTQLWDKWPMFQVMDNNGTVIDAAPLFDTDESRATDMYKMMLRVQAVDDILYNAQVCI